MTGRLKNLSPFGRKALLSAAKHIALAWQRRILRIPTERAAERLRENGFKVEVLAENCHVCGYALVSFAVPQGWTIQGCSATLVASILRSPAFETWCADLPQVKTMTAPQREEAFQTTRP